MDPRSPFDTSGGFHPPDGSPYSTFFTTLGASSPSGAVFEQHSADASSLHLSTFDSAIPVEPQQPSSQQPSTVTLLQPPPPEVCIIVRISSLYCFINWQLTLCTSQPYCTQCCRGVIHPLKNDKCSFCISTTCYFLCPFGCQSLFYRARRLFTLSPFH